MTDDAPAAATRAFENHDAYERAGAGYVVTTTPFDAVVTAEATERAGRDAILDVRVTVPTLDAAVGGETVAPVVEDGWFDTLVLRLEDAYDAVEVDPVAEPAIERDEEVVDVRFRFTTWDASRGVDDAKAVVDFVEGTYVQGIVPGYEYDDPVAGLLQRATRRTDGTAEGAERGGTPL